MGTGCFSIFAFPLLAGMPMICEFCRRIKIFVITASSKNSKPTLKKKRKKDDKIVLLVK